MIDLKKSFTLSNSSGTITLSPSELREFFHELWRSDDISFEVHREGDMHIIPWVETSVNARGVHVCLKWEEPL